ncbi:MAG: NFACT RNA binding domain-containing protein [Candidatus Pacearchaeota archaeon]
MSKIKATNFRKALTSSGKLMLGGKNAEQNEEIVKQAAKDEVVLHTKAAGSPFVNIKGKASRRDIKEAAIFCAAYSRDWKKNKKDVEVHYFKGKDIFKTKDMALGTFGVKKVKKIIVNKEEIEKFLEKK